MQIEYMPIGFPQFPPQEDEPQDAKPKSPVPWLPDDMIHIRRIIRHPSRKIRTICLNPNLKPNATERTRAVSNIGIALHLRWCVFRFNDFVILYEKFDRY